MPVLQTLAVLDILRQIAGPAAEGLAKLVTAVKEPLGKKKLEELRKELATGLEGIQKLMAAYGAAIEAVNADLSTQQRQLDQMRQELEYHRLPFYKRWFAPKPWRLTNELPVVQ